MAMWDNVRPVDVKCGRNLNGCERFFRSQIASATICASVAIWWQKVVPAWMAIVLVVASAGIGFFLGRRSAPITPPMSGDGSSELIDTIAFKYSDLPTNHGWRITQDDIDNRRQCQLMLQSDSEVGQYVPTENSILRFSIRM